MEPYSPDVLWILIIGFVIAFVLAFGIGANDVANSFGTSVGSGVLSIRAACWLATVCEISGAVLIGYKVSDTMRKGILDINVYKDSETELMLGFLSALASSALWLLAATFLKLPISGTHSIVGSTIGFSIVVHGTRGIQWRTLGTIISSWFVSPVMSGLMSTGLYWGIRAGILNAKNPLNAGLIALPIFYGLTIFVNVLSIVHDGPKLLHMDNIASWLALTISLVVGFTVAIGVQLIIVPWQRRKITNARNGGPVTFTINDSTESTPNGSPKKMRRPGADTKQLPAITEQTELSSFNNLSGVNPSLYANPQKYGQHADVKVANGFVNGTHSHNMINYKIDPKIIEKAENLLGKASLDNTDLTITSLNFIDEHHTAANGIVPTDCNGRTLQAHFDSKHVPSNSRADPSFLIQSNTHANEVVIPISNTTIFSGKVHNNGDTNCSNNNNSTKRIAAADIDSVESTVNFENMVSATLSPNSSKVPLIAQKPDETNKIDEPEDVSALFSFLQILTATFGSFAHGGNDVSNAIGPLIALWMIYTEGSVMQRSETPVTLLMFGGVGISVGLWLWGRRVIETVGNDLTKITPSTGFTIEIGAALTVLMASKIGIPISTTHCKVGSVVFVGYANAPPYTQEDKDAGLPRPQAVDWSLFRNIVYAWVVTVPIAAMLSALFMFILRRIVL